MELDPVILSRLQFAWVIAWHILLPAFSAFYLGSGIATFAQGLVLGTFIQGFGSAGCNSPGPRAVAGDPYVLGRSYWVFRGKARSEIGYS